MIRARQARYAQQQALYAQQGQYAGPSRPVYGPPPGDPYATYGPGYGGGYGYGYGGYGGYPQRQTGSALPLLGALAGGLLLGDIIGGGLGGGF
jgi:hypothetical protein